MELVPSSRAGIAMLGIWALSMTAVALRRELVWEESTVTQCTCPDVHSQHSVPSMPEDHQLTRDQFMGNQELTATRVENTSSVHPMIGKLEGQVTVQQSPPPAVESPPPAVESPHQAPEVSSTVDMEPGPAQDFVPRCGAGTTGIPRHAHPQPTAIDGTDQSYVDFPPASDDSLHKMVDWPDIAKEKMAEIRRRFDRTHKLTVVVLGGSMTGGALCKQSLVGFELDSKCAWAHRVEYWLKAAFPTEDVVLYNLARGGTQTEVALTSLYIQISGLPRPPDIILTDFAINDIHEFAGNAGHESAVVAATGAAGGQVAKAAAIAETLIQELAELFPLAVHAMVFSHCPACATSEILHSMADVAHYTKTAVIDSRHLCEGWPVLKDKTNDCPYWSKNDKHPDYRSHQVLADVAVFAIRKGLLPECVGPAGTFSAPDLLEQVPKCMRPTTTWSSYEEFAKPSNGDRGGWLLMEDRKGKPGWIATENGAKATFSVTFGQLPVLTITYLRSYEGMGKAKISLNGRHVLLEGLWEKRMSTSQTFFSQAYSHLVQNKHASDNDHYGVLGFAVEPRAVLDLTVEFQSVTPGDKFKLIQITAC
jgi:hypothetical protein